MKRKWRLRLGAAVLCAVLLGSCGGTAAAPAESTAPADPLTGQQLLYPAQRAALDFPQPFRTLEDAWTFLTLYGGGAPAEDDLRTKLISTGDPDFPWQLPGVRRFGMIAFSTEEGEHICTRQNACWRWSWRW